jgi:hypothetical protein
MTVGVVRHGGMVDSRMKGRIQVVAHGVATSAKMGDGGSQLRVGRQLNPTPPEFLRGSLTPQPGTQ